VSGPIALLSVLPLTAAVRGPVTRTLSLTAATRTRELSAALMRTHLTLPRTATRAAASAIAVDLALVHRELGQLPLGLLPFRSRQRRANQTTMNGTVIVGALVALGFDGLLE
jgi:hypothetical protein